MTNPYDAGGVLDRKAQIGLNAWFKQGKLAYDNDKNPLYLGRNARPNAGTAEGSWAIWKFTYDNDGDLTDWEGPLTGSWDNRASLDWN